MLTIILNKYLNLALKLEIKMETFILCLFVKFVFIWRRGAAFSSVPNSLQPNMANNIENHGHYGQKISQIWPQYGHFFNEFWPYFQFLLHFYVTIFFKNFKFGKKFYKLFLQKFPKWKSENSKMKIVGRICPLPQNFVNVKLKIEIWPKWP